MAVGAWVLLWVGVGADLAGALVAGFALDLLTGAVFLGDAPAVFFAGLAPVPALGFALVVSRETSGIKAPKPRPKLCRFAITLTFLFTFSDFSRRS